MITQLYDTRSKCEILTSIWFNLTKNKYVNNNEYGNKTSSNFLAFLLHQIFVLGLFDLCIFMQI